MRTVGEVDVKEDAVLAPFADAFASALSYVNTSRSLTPGPATVEKATSAAKTPDSTTRESRGIVIE